MAEAKATIIVTAKDQASQNINAALKSINRELGQMAQAQKHAAEASHGFKLNIVDLAAKLYLIQVGVRNVVQALQGIYEFGKLGATVEQTARSYQMVADNIGIATGQLELLKEASRGTISDMRLMQMSNQALVGTTGDFSQVMADALPKLLEIARASAILNPQLGDTEYQFDRLTLGLKRLEPRIIDDIGLEIRLTEVNKNYAEQLGKSADSLTTQERSYALLNAVLARHGDYLALVGGQTESSVDSYSKLETATKNLRDATAEYTNNGLKPAVEWLTKYVEGAHQLFDLTTNGQNEVTDALNRSSEELSKSNLSQAEYEKLLRSQAESTGYLIDEEGRLYELRETFGHQYKRIIDDTYLLSEAERNAIKIGDERRENIEAMRQGLVDYAQASETAKEEEEKWREQRDETLDDLFLKELDINQKLIDQRAKLGQKSIDIDTDYQDRLTEIHAEAEEDRIDIASRAAEEREDIQRRYNERIADIDKDLAQLRLEYEGKNPFLSETTQRELEDVEANAESLRDTIKRLRREQRLDPNDAREQLITDYEARLEEVEEHLSNIRNRAREEERKARIAFRMQEKEEEKRALEEKRDQEINILNEQLRIKLETSVANEEALTVQITAEYTKRRIAINNEMNQIAEEANRRMKEATVDALLSLVPAGSAAEQKLMEMKFKIHGATDEMIAQFWRTRDSIAGPDSLVSAIDRFAMAGFATFFSMQGVVAGLNGQLMFTNFLLGQQQELSIHTGGGGAGMKRQHGGPVSANRPYVVGEAGPELFVPSGAGNIVPNDQMGGGANLIININATAFQGSQADAIRFGNWVGPIVLQYLDRFGGNVNAVGARKIRSG